MFPRVLIIQGMDETWMANGAMLPTRQSASIGPLSTLHPYQEDNHRRVEYRRSTEVDKAQGQAPIPQDAWRSTICEDPAIRSLSMICSPKK
jgi:hypothetical protein